MLPGQGKYFDPTFNGTEGTWRREGYSTDVYTDIALEWLEERDPGSPRYIRTVWGVGYRFSDPDESG